jgi:2-polyprenyl-6-methoxyphenol hydroxylase-like FAD-dependent oxidoreductase
MPDFDIIVVGGGLGGSSFGIAMARHGANILVLEQELLFRDRVRGEFLAPWGLAEAKSLGLFETFCSAGAREIPWFELGMGPRDLTATTIQKLPALSYSHPRIQEALIDAARKAGAKVRRGVAVRKIEPGANLAVECGRNGSIERITARLIVAADGRNSAARKWGGFSSQRDEHPFLLAGVLLGNVCSREDLASVIYNPANGYAVAAFPQGGGVFRAYMGYPSDADKRIQGEENLGLFLAGSAKASPMVASTFAKAQACGPLASFDTNDSWVEQPHRDGIALIGDAAAISDPTFGQGMSLTLRDARVLRDELCGDTDWERAGHRYAQRHDLYFANCHAVANWFRHIFLEQTTVAAVQRSKALPLIAQDPMRVPDHLNSGPDLPVNDAVRARFFGES